MRRPSLSGPIAAAALALSPAARAGDAPIEPPPEALSGVYAGQLAIVALDVVGAEVVCLLQEGSVVEPFAAAITEHGILLRRDASQPQPDYHVRRKKGGIKLSSTSATEQLDRCSFSDPAGRWFGERVRLELRATNAAFVGWLALDGGNHALEARFTNGWIRGHYADRDSRHAFRLLPAGINLWLETSRARHILNRETELGESVTLGRIAFRRLPAGSFTMGTPDDEDERRPDEARRDVVLTYPFWLGVHEVTQRQWNERMLVNPSYKDSRGRPVERVSWSDAMRFCRRLTEVFGDALPPGYTFRLPTEAEWEYACRAGTTTATAFGPSLSSRRANFNGGYPYNGAARGPNRGKTLRVGALEPNAWGIHDMHGNVAEWCYDWYTNAPPAGRINPIGPARGEQRVVRGGSWVAVGSDCRSGCRHKHDAGNKYYALGFRVAIAPKLEP